MYKYLFFFIVLVGCTSESTTSNSNNALSIKELQKAAMKQYMDSPVLAIPKMEKLADQYALEADYNGASETYFNIASIYETTLDEKDKALIYGQKALENAMLGKNEKQQANLLKYVGYQKGLVGKMLESKNDLVKAVMKYKSLNDETSVAATYFDLARVFYMEGGLEESAHFLSKSSGHFRLIKDAENIFRNNLFAISLFSKMQQNTEVQKAIQENKSLIPSIKYEGTTKREFEELMKNYDSQ